VFHEFSAYTFAVFPQTETGTLLPVILAISQPPYSKKNKTRYSSKSIEPELSILLSKTWSRQLISP
jgi:hypothetical protein